jgi:hypothetical protein
MERKQLQTAEFLQSFSNTITPAITLLASISTFLGYRYCISAAHLYESLTVSYSILVRERESVNRLQMNIKHETCNVRNWKKHLFLDVSITNIDTLVTPPFQPLRYQRNVCHQGWQTLPTVNRKHSFMNMLCIESFCPQKTHNRTLLFGTILPKHSSHFDYWNQSLNMRMRICYLECYGAGLCCYLMIYIEELLCPLQLFCFYLWPIYWLPRGIESFLVFITDHVFT